MSSNVSISLAVSTVTVTKVTTLTTSCLTSVWILTSVWKADLIATSALILREGNKTSAVYPCYTSKLFSLLSFGYLTVSLSHVTCRTFSNCNENK